MKKLHCPIQTSITALPYAYSELEAILDYLKSETVAPDEQKAFPKGTITQDGRLDMCKQSLGAEGCAFIVEALWDNEFVNSILLGTDSIGDEGADKVAQLIEHNGNIETVYLGCNYIGSEGVAKLCEAISKSESVHALWLKRNPIGIAGALQLAQLLKNNQVLRTLDLVNTLIETEGLAAICEALTTSENSLERIYLGGNFLDATAVPHLANLLQKKQNLKALLLNVNNLGDEGGRELALALAENKGLEELGLASCGLGEKAICSLFEQLENHPKLLSLDLGYSPSSKVLGASANQISDRAAAALAHFLKHNKTLISLNLSRTGLSDAGKKMLLEGLAQNHTLQYLQVDGQAAMGVNQYLEANKKLYHKELPVSEDVKRIKSVYR